MSLLYALARIVEFTGLWYQTTWGKIFCAASGGIYIPAELESMTHHITLFNSITLLVNIAVVCFMLYKLRRQNPPNKNPVSV